MFFMCLQKCLCWFCVRVTACLLAFLWENISISIITDMACTPHAAITMWVVAGKTAIFCICLIAFGFLILSEVDRYRKDRTNISTSTEKNLNPYVPSFTICHTKPYINVREVKNMMERGEYKKNTYSCKATFRLDSQCGKYVESVKTVYSGNCFMFTRTASSSGIIGTAQLEKTKDFKIYFHRSYKLNEIIYNQIFIKSSKTSMLLTALVRIGGPACDYGGLLHAVWSHGSWGGLYRNKPSLQVEKKMTNLAFKGLLWGRFLQLLRHEAKGPFWNGQEVLPALG